MTARGFAWQRTLWGLVVGAAGIAVVTAVTWALKQVVPVSALASLYVLAILPVAVGSGVWPALIIAVVSALAFDFFFYPPLFVFSFTDPYIEAVLVISGVTALVVSELAGRVRQRADQAESLARELRRIAEERSALRRVATLVAQAATPEQVFAAVTAEVGRVLDADFTFLSRYDPDGAATIIGASDSTGAAGPVPIGTRMDFGGQNVHTLVFQTHRPVRIADYAAASGAAADVARGWNIRSAVGVPISVEGRVWGAMSVASTQQQPLPAETEARLTSFTELVATAVANAESQAQLSASRARIVAAADHVRRRIERDLHDGAQQRLVSLALQLRAAQEAMPPEAGELHAQLDSLAVEATSALDELRELARGIHPAVLAKGGLRPALTVLARRCAVPVELDVRVDGRLPEQIEIAAYYVISEALTNAAKHAHASIVHAELDAGGGVLVVRVRDDGRGGADLSGGSGFVGIKDRVEALSGQLSVQTAPGAGTCVQVELPLGPRAGFG